jgi:nitrogen fixation protein NifQ
MSAMAPKIRGHTMTASLKSKLARHYDDVAPLYSGADLISLTPWPNTHNVNSSRQSPNRDDQTPNPLSYYKTVIKSQLLGRSALPYGLGLTLTNYQELLLKLNDPQLDELDQQWTASTASTAQQRSRLLADLVTMRLSERDALVSLFCLYQSKSIPFVDSATIVIATACLNPTHLWESLGLNNRLQLSEWLEINFPNLAGANTRNMRWKRFFYLQLCEQGGDYVCRAPSCEQCVSFDECFGPE